MGIRKKTRAVVTFVAAVATLALMTAAATPGASAAIRRTPANDDVASATVISRPSGSISGSNVGATFEVDEPDIEGDDELPTVWYRYTAPADGVFVVDTCRRFTFDTMLKAIEFTTATVGFGAGYAELEENDDWDDDDPPIDLRRCNGYSSSIHVDVTAGDTYHIGVTGYDGQEGRFVLSWRFTPDRSTIA